MSVCLFFIDGHTVEPRGVKFGTVAVLYLEQVMAIVAGPNGPFVGGPRDGKKGPFAVLG